MLEKVQSRENLPLLSRASDRKTTKRARPEVATVNAGKEQNWPSDDELVLEPSYSVTLSYPHSCDRPNSPKVADITYIQTVNLAVKHCDAVFLRTWKV